MILDANMLEIFDRFMRTVLYARASRLQYSANPDNPNLTDYEKDVVQYINQIHSYFHGKFPQDYIAVIYFVVEVFDNSPGRKNAMGQKIKPKLP